MSRSLWHYTAFSSNDEFEVQCDLDFSPFEYKCSCSHCLCICFLYFCPCFYCGTRVRLHFLLFVSYLYTLKGHKLSLPHWMSIKGMALFAAVHMRGVVDNTYIYIYMYIYATAHQVVGKCKITGTTTTPSVPYLSQMDGSRKKFTTHLYKLKEVEIEVNTILTKPKALTVLLAISSPERSFVVIKSLHRCRRYISISILNERNIHHGALA